jgi:GT2 family glycosyltransferase
MAIQVSVVVPTFKRPDLLDRCLQALLAQDFDPTAYEVIVVDDAADQQAKLPGSLVQTSSLPRLRYLSMPKRRGPAAARNRGWQAAAGAIIAFTDDDCLPAPGWLKNGTRALARGASGASGQVIVPLPPSPTDYEANAAGLAQSRFVTANCFYLRSALSSVGGFDETFNLPWREDSDLYFRLLACGHLLVEAPDAVVVHPVRPARWGASLRQQRKSMYNALLYRKHPAIYRQRIQAAPPWHYYAAVGSLLALPAAFLAGSLPLALGGLAAWMALTAAFCARRLRRTSHALGHVMEMLVTSALIPPLSVYWRLRGALTFRVFFL